MIKLTKIDGRVIIINADEIETVEEAYDSMISLISGKKVIVRESSDEIIEKVVEYKKKILSARGDALKIKRKENNG